jgi:hypothetical protein
MKYWQVLLFLFLSSSLVSLVFTSGLVKVEIKGRREHAAEATVEQVPVPAFFDESGNNSSTVTVG